MSSEFGENCLYFCDFACMFVILPVHVWIWQSMWYLVRVRASASSCSCWYTHFCGQNIASCIYVLFVHYFLKLKLTLTLILKTEFYIDINVETDGDVISHTSDYRPCECWLKKRLNNVSLCFTIVFFRSPSLEMTLINLLPRWWGWT